MAFELARERHGSVLVLTPRGRLDNDSASEFELAAQEVLAAGERHLVVDLSELNYISNAGLRVLGMLGKALKTETTSLRLCGLSPGVRQVFDAAGVAVMFDLRADLARALGDHPAARGADELGRHAARLLGVAGAAPVGSEPASIAATANDAVRTLAGLALELLASGGGLAAQPRAARVMAGGTQVVARVRAASAPPAPAAAEARPGFFQRLFGRRKQPR